MEKKKTNYSIEELNQYIQAADRLQNYYANKAAIDRTGEATKLASKYRAIKENLISETEKIISELAL